MNLRPLGVWRPSLTISFANANDPAKNSELI